MNKMWQGEIEILKQITPPVLVTRASFICPYCSRLNWVYFIESQLNRTINTKCRECEGVWSVKLKEVKGDNKSNNG